MRDHRRLNISGIFRALPALIGGMLVIFSVAYAMPPNPEALERKLSEGSPLPYYLQNASKLTHQGINKSAKISGAIHKTALAPSFKALAILIKFSDKNSSVAAAEFDTLLFVNQQGTVRNYYNEVSYGQLDIVTVNLPSTVGWVTAPSTYAYYCNGQNGTGSYPQNCQKLCEDVVALVDASVDFSQYDNDDDGYVDALILVHTGPGAEFTLSDNDIWSHQWATFLPPLKDGVYIYNYCIMPEYWNSAGDITCGVFCHELGHIFGLPDLYDTDSPADSYGIGKWSIMSYGSWNGPSGMGDYPAHFDAWSRIQLGFTSYVNVTANMSDVNIISVENEGSIYRLWSSGGAGDEYYLVENRQKSGYDTYLPGAGLLIWHIDDSQSSNDNQWYPGHTGSGHYLVALEQADSLFELEKKLSAGNTGDPFPGSTSRTVFSPFTTPNSNTYDGENTYVSVSNISPSGATMTADFQVSFASGIDNPSEQSLPQYARLSQNFPNPFNPSTNIGIILPSGTDISLIIYDILGQPVRRLLDEYHSAGAFTIQWDGRNDQGNQLPSGVYFYELSTGQESEVRKMLLIK
jgi:immune inhibitor A